MTAWPVRAKEERRHGVIFSLTHVARRNIFGTVTLWRGRTRVAVADVHRTIVDMLDNPALGGGMQHVADCLAAYLKRSDRDDRQLLAYADRLGNGAVFKRLGFLAEAESRGAPLAAACRERLTAGRAKLDPVLPADRLVTRWRLWVPATWSRA
jgi:predicted transcriptional regulator of viral defense system